MIDFDNGYQTLTTYIYMTCDCICHTAYISTLVYVVYLSSIVHKPLSSSCVAYHVAVVVVVVVVVMCIYSCHYKNTCYTFVICLCRSQWCDNENHDLPQHVIRTVKIR